ncbi:hypothetical protein [Labrys miyagiensis]
MSISDVIAVLGSLITIVCAGISIKQARDAKNYSSALKAAKTRIGLLTVAERLRTAQDPIGQLPQTPSTLRGSKPDITITKIRTEFDRALSSLEKNGPGNSARTFLEGAQASLDIYEDSVHRVSNKEANFQLDVSAMRIVRTSVQNAIVEIIEAAGKMDSQ